MKTVFALGALALVLSASLAVALDPITVPTSTVPGEADLYVVVDENAPSASIWQESNGLAGLQQTATTLADGTVVPADAQLA